MLDLLELLLALAHSEEIPPADMDGRTYRRHLHFNGVQPELFHRTRASNTAIAQETCRLLVPFGVDVVQCVLQNGRGAMRIFRGREDEAIKAGDLLLPTLRDLVFRCSPNGRSDLVEEGQGKIAQVDDLDLDIGMLTRYANQPFDRCVGKTPFARRTDHDGDPGLGHTALSL